MSNLEWSTEEKKNVTALLGSFWKIDPELAQEYISALRKFFPSTVLKCLRQHFQTSDNHFRPKPAELHQRCQDYVRDSRAVATVSEEMRREGLLQTLYRVGSLEALWEAPKGEWIIERYGLVRASFKDAARDSEPGALGRVVGYEQIDTETLQRIVDECQMAEEDRALLGDEEYWRPRSFEEHFRIRKGLGDKGAEHLKDLLPR